VVYLPFIFNLFICGKVHEGGEGFHRRGGEGGEEEKEFLWYFFQDVVILVRLTMMILEKKKRGKRGRKKRKKKGKKKELHANTTCNVNTLDKQSQSIMGHEFMEEIRKGGKGVRKREEKKKALYLSPAALTAESAKEERKRPLPGSAA